MHNQLLKEQDHYHLHSSDIVQALHACVVAAHQNPQGHDHEPERELSALPFGTSSKKEKISLGFTSNHEWIEKEKLPDIPYSMLQHKPRVPERWSHKL